MDKKTLNVEDFLGRVQNDKELFFELLDIFVSDFQGKREELGDAIAKGDAQGVEHVAHFLKGSCGNISAESLRGIFTGLEERGSKGDLDGVEKYLDDIDRKFEELAVRIGELRGTL